MTAQESEVKPTELELLQADELRPIDQKLFNSVISGDLNDVTACLAAGANLHAKGNVSETPFLTAAANSHVDLCVALYLAGSDPKAKTDYGMTVTHFAGNSKNHRLLLAAAAMGVSLLPNGNWPNVPGQFKTQRLTDAAAQSSLMAAVNLNIPALVLHVLERYPTTSDEEFKRCMARAKKLGPQRESVITVLRSWQAKQQAVAALDALNSNNPVSSGQGRQP